MSLTQLLNQPCTIVRRLESADTDQYGNEITDDELVDTVCLLQPLRSQLQATMEPRTEGETARTTETLYLPAGTEITTADAVIVEGRAFEMVGEPLPIWNPRTRAYSHIEASVRRVAGAEDPGS